MLSHYTTRDGLEGIAKSGSLWASNFLTVNDKSEFFYAWAELLKAGWRYALARVPEDLKRQDLDLEGAIELQAANSIPMFRSMVQSTEGYGHLFITSFAQARTADHERRGILTIWARYTGHKGYCLQFDKGDIEHMISVEAMRGSYQWIELAEVKYGVDPNTCTFRELAAQLGEQFLMQVMREYAD